MSRTAIRVDEIYHALRQAKKGNWRYDESTQHLIIDLGANNIIKTRIPDKPVGNFIADSAQYVSWLLEAILTVDECAQGILESDEQKTKFIKIVDERLFPAPRFDDPEKATAETKGAPVAEATK